MLVTELSLLFIPSTPFLSLPLPLLNLSHVFYLYLLVFFNLLYSFISHFICTFLSSVKGKGIVTFSSYCLSKQAYSRTLLQVIVLSVALSTFPTLSPLHQAKSLSLDYQPVTFCTHSAWKYLQGLASLKNEGRQARLIPVFLCCTCSHSKWFSLFRNNTILFGEYHVWIHECYILFPLLYRFHSQIFNHSKSSLSRFLIIPELQM